jgi:hypothetical protein
MSWNINALIVSDTALVPGFTDRQFNRRDWCWGSKIPILEVFQNDTGKMVPRIIDNILYANAQIDHRAALNP